MKAITFFLLLVFLFASTGCTSSCDTLIKTVCTENGTDSRKCKEISTILNNGYLVDLGCSKNNQNYTLCKQNEIIFNSIIHEKEHYCSKAMMLYNKTK